MKIKGLFVCFLLCLILESFGQIPSNFPQNGLLAYYSFEGNTNDVSGNGNHLTNYGASLSNDKNGKSNSSYSFNGTSNYMQGPNTLGNIFYSNVQIGTNTIDGTTKLGALSISFWGKAATGNFISKYWNLDKNQSNFSVSNNRFTGDGTNYIDYQGTSSTDWKHYVIVITNGTNNSKIYINGVLSASGTLNLNTTATQAPFMVGRLYGSPEGYLNGSIDEIALFNRILSDQEAKAIYDLEVNKNPFNLPVSTISTNLSTISEVIGNSGSTVITASLATAPINDVKIDLETAGTATFDSDYTIDFTKKGKGVQVAGSSAAGAGLGDLSNPLGVTLDQVGNVYVADGYNHRIVKWEKDASIGTLVAGGNGQGSAANQFSVPNGVAVDKDGNIYVSDYANNRIQKWAKDATSGITILGGNGVGDSPNQIIKPVAICADSSGNIYVADSGNNRIQKWTVGSGNTATTVAGGNASGSALNQLAFPIGVKVDQSGNLYVAENGNHRVTKWAPGATQGVVVAGGNGGGLGLNQFNYPQGLGLDLQGNIYVSDYQSNSVKKWAPGATTGEIVAGATVSGNFVDAPFDMEADKFGNLFITDNRNQRILKLQFQPQFVIPAGQLTGNITVKGLPDQVNETDETIILTPLNKNYYYDGLSPINIKLNNINRIVSFSSDKSTIEEAGGSTVITATLNEAGLSDVTFGFTATGTATLNTDFKASSATVTIPAGQLSASFTITGINDLLNEDNETIVLTPLNVINASVGSGVSINMTSEDLPPSILFGLSSTTNNEAGAAITLTTRLSNKSAKTITATLSLAGTATKTSDYTLSAETLTFAPGDSIKTITITPVNDTDVEAVETLIVSIASSTNLSTTYPSSTISIASEDKPNVTLSLDKATISENAGTATLTATLSAATSYDVVMELSKTGTAVESSDFKFTRSGVVQIPASITIPAGQTTGTIDIIGQNDIYDEPDETVIINTSSISNANAPASSVTLTIVSDDLPPSVAFDLSENTLTESSSAITLTARLSNKSAKTITATLSLAGTATKTSDYTLSSETLTFAPGDSIKTVTITPVNDVNVEAVETVIISIASSTNLSTPYPSSTISIASEDKPNVTLSLDKATISENAGTATLTATLSAATSYDVVMELSKTGTAVESSDFKFTRSGVVQIPASITIPAGQTTGTIDIIGQNDIYDEPDETVIINTSSISNANAPASSVTLTIVSDDLPPSVALELSSNTLDEAGSAITLTGRLSKKAAKTITATISLAGTATKTSDYTLNSETFTFAPGDSIKTIIITPVNDTNVEVNETIIVGVASSSNLSTTYPSAVTVNLISDDNAGITLSLDKTSIAENNGKATLTATLAAPSSKDVVINLKAIGTSENEYDYNLNFSSKGNARTVAGGNGQGGNADQLSNPNGVFVDNVGNIYVDDQFNHRIQKWEIGSKQGITVAGGNGMGSNANQLSYPNGIYLDNNENLYIADRDNNRIQKWAKNAVSGITVAGGNGAGSGSNQLNWPHGIYLDQLNNIYITDQLNQRIQKWSPNSTVGVTIAGGNGQGGNSNQFSLPHGLFVDKLGNIFTSDRGNHRIQKWAQGASSGLTIAGGNGFGSSSTQFESPYGFSIDKNYNIFVADLGNHRIQKWGNGSKSGITVAGGNGNGSGSNQLSFPSEVFVDSFGNLFISDQNNHRIQKIQYQPQIIIPAGQTTGTLEIVGLDDNLDEADETITLEAVSVENGSMPTGPVSLTITSDDLPPVATFELSAPSVDEDKSAVTLTVRLNKKAGKTITANLSFSGTANKGVDYTLSAENFTIASGDSIATITITPTNDTAIEIIESITIGITSASGLDANFPTATLNILSEDKPNVAVSTSASTINEVKGQSTLTATLSAPTAKDVYVDLNLKGTATFDKDYQLDFVGKGVGQLLFEKGKKYGDTTLTLPQKIAVDTANNLWVYDSGRLLKTNPKDKTIIKTININANDLQITLEGIVHVLNGSTIYRYDLDGKLLESFAIPGWNNAPPRSFYYKNGFYYLAFNSDIYKLNYSTKSTVLFASITNSIHPMGIFRLVVKDNDELIFTDRNSVFKYKNNSVSSYIILSAFDPNYFNSENPYIELLPNGNVLVYRETPPSQTRNLSLEEFDSNGSKVKTWLSLAQSPIKNEFTGLGSFAIIPGKTDLYMSYYIDQSKLGSSYDVYNRNQIYQFPFKPSIKIPAGQTTGSLTFEGLEDLENEATETIDVKFASVQNANSPIGTAPTISITDNRITFTALNTAIPALTESALSWGDYDRDGDQDLAIMGYNDASGYQTAVWRNDNGTFNNTFQNLLRTSNGDIKWVDIDKDGYLDLMCSGVAIDASDVTSNKTVLYLNNKKGGLINAGTLNVEQLSGTKMAFGDLDNDGDLDLAILGYNSLDQAVFYLYEKDNNALAYNKITDFNAPMMSGTSLDWDLKIADFDLDGDNDIIYRGGSITNSYVQSNSLNFNINYTGLKYEVVKLFNRTGPLSVLAIGQQNGTNQFYSNEMIGFNGNAPALSEGDIAAGDFNNDGLNDFVVTGSDASNNPLTLLYYQRADNQFELMPNITLEGLYSSTADWVDYDVDGDLDLILTGRGASTQKTILYRNDTGTKVNKAPKAPANLRVTDKGNGFVEFAWDTPADDFSTYLGYNIRLGTSPGGTELSNTQSNLETGSRLITAPAPIYGNTYTTQLSPGKYYWSVQAIDQGFQGSPFATEKEVLLQYEWKTINQKNIINRTVSGGSSPKVLMVDYDNDKDLDLIIGSSSDRRVYQFDGRMFVPSTVSIGYGGVDNMIAEDINGDGKMDLVVNNTNGSNLTLSVYFNNGTGYNLAHTMSYPSLVNSRIKVLDLDSDGLQEVLIAGSTSLLSTASTKVYRLEYAGPQDPSINPTGVAFNEYTVNLTTGMTGVTTYDFGDINNDSKIDLIISGKTSNGLKTKIFLNNTVAGQTGDLTFTLTTDNLVATTAGTTDLVDYDGDGDLDILQTGTSGNGDVFQLYENTLQNNVANFSVINIGIDPIRNSKVRFGDFNGDGFFDLFFNGTRNTVSGQINQLVQLNPVSKLYETSTFNTGNLVNIEFAFADIESDGDLDLVITGDDATNANNKILNVYQNVRNQSAALNSLINQSVVEPKKSNNNMLNRLIDEQKMAHLGAGVSYNLNTRPAAPAIKSLTTATINNQKVLTFAWNKSIDDHTPTTGLTYNLRIGTTATNDDILPSNATNDGVLKIPMEGNAEHNLSTSLKNLKDGVYYWSVQAIDAAFSGSTFSTPVKFEVINGSLKTSNPPIVTDGTSTTNSGIAQGIVIANLSASDPDGDPLTYAFVSGNESGIFSINTSGQLILSTKPAVFQDPYILVISVSDGSNSRTLTYRVNFCESNFEATAQHLNITKTYKSKDSLKATSKVQGSSNITMEAPKSIELKPGFVAEKGTVFRANIGAGCQ